MEWDTEMARILLAEDDDAMRQFLATALGRAGHEVVSCPDGREALAALSTEYDLLIADIVMPGSTASNWRAARARRCPIFA